MALTPGEKQQQTLHERYSREQIREWRSLGGKRSKGTGFAKATPEQRASWGKLGGLKSKRGKAL